MRELIIFLSIFILAACNLLRSGDKEYNPEIVFSAEDNKGTPQIYTMNADGLNVTKLTNWEEGASKPSWSPDGKTILFSSFRKGTSIGPGMWVMKADGDNKHPLYEYQTGNALEGNNARWSPDGKQVVYDLCANCQLATNYEIYILDPQTEEATKLTEHVASDTHPVWSPDGTKIAFVSDRDYMDADTLRFRKDLYVMNSDGSNLKRITKTGYAREPVWKPGGDVIAFRSTGDTPGLYEINLRDSNISMIKKDAIEKLHLHPQNWFDEGNKLLITVRSLSPSYNNSVVIYDLTSNEEQSIYSGTPINRADFIKHQN